MIKYKDLSISFSNVRSLSIQLHQLDLPDGTLDTETLYKRFAKEGYLIVTATREDDLVGFAVFDMSKCGLVSYYANKKEEYLLPQLLGLVKASFDVRMLGLSVYKIKNCDGKKPYNDLNRKKNKNI